MRHLPAGPRSLALLLPSAALAAAPAAQDCIAIDDAASRLACYDAAHRRTPKTPEASQPAPASAAQSSAKTLAPMAGEPSALSSIWELEPSEKRGTFRLLPHKLNYLLPVHYTTRANTMPSSPAPDHNVPFELPVDATEAKFQLSFKVKAWENVFGDNGDLWLAYTQQSNWQLYNPGVSSPFRETDYEPEVILSMRTDADILGWRWRLFNLGFVHQSNGRPLPLSRSWNRVYAQFGLERGNFTLLARPWLRVPESADDDDNPDIRDYMGSGDLRLAYANAGHVWSALGRYSSSGKRGGLQFDWAYPISGALKGYLQVTTGYGASLIDYNHSQTTIGLGLLLLPWQ